MKTGELLKVMEIQAMMKREEMDQIARNQKAAAMVQELIIKQ